MARTEDVHKAIWSKPEFRRLSPDAKCLYFWTFTCQECNTAGLFEVARDVIEFATGLRAKRCDASLAELATEGFAFYVDSVVWVRSRWRHYRTKSPNTAKAVGADLGLIADDHPLKARFVAEYGDCSTLSELLSGIRIPKPIAEGPSQGLTEPLQGLLGTGKGIGKGTTENSNGEPDGFAGWLEHHEQTTGMRPPREGTKVRAHVAAMFAERRREGYDTEDLQAATVGAFNDEHRREHGYYDPESVLRPTRVHKLVELGRRKPPPPKGPQRASRAVVSGTGLTCRRCPAPIDGYRANNQHGLCDGCAALHEAHLLGGAA